MGVTRKRSRLERGGNQKRKHGDKDNPDAEELVVYCILCPNSVMGRVIGKNGTMINSIRQETPQATITVFDPFPGADKRVITIDCSVNAKDIDVDEDSTKPLCPAQDALLKVHAAIVNAVANARSSDKKDEKEAYLLVRHCQVENIIGKSGVTINKLRYKTKANIKVYPKYPKCSTHSCAERFNNYVQITGDAEAVKRALFAVSAIIYKFSSKEEISFCAAVAELPPTIIPSDVRIHPDGSFYPSGDVIVPPSRSMPHVPGIHVHSSSLPVVSGYGGPSRSAKLVLRVLCPSDKIGHVIGEGGNTINNIRQASGASIVVNDNTKKGVDECIITITSTESNDDVASAALEAVLQLQEKINDDEDIETANICLLVPPKVVGYLIGKNGSIVNDIRKKTKADIRISKRASSSDELVEVLGEVCNMLEAVVQIIIKMREYALGDRDDSETHNAPQV